MCERHRERGGDGEGPGVFIISFDAASNSDWLVKRNVRGKKEVAFIFVKIKIIYIFFFNPA